MTIQAIETHYAGHRFRSRLEARWAVFFNTLGIRWEYEPQGYYVGEQRRPYLPDFYLTDLHTWVEVKGTGERLDMPLLRDAVHPKLGLGRTDGYYRTRVLILGDVPRPGRPYAHWSIHRSANIGVPPSPVPGCGGCIFTSPLYELSAFLPIPDLMPDLMAEKVGATAEQLSILRSWGAALQPMCRSTHEPSRVDLTDAVPVPRMRMLPRLDMAYEKARAARFEHGEVPV